VGATVPGLVEVNVTDSSVGQNTASNGAISNGIAGRVTIERSTIEGNTVSAYGGGIHNQGFFGPDALQPVTIVRNSTLAQNSAAFRGGGVFNQAGILEIFQSTLSGNQATSGGGGFLSSFKPFEPSESAEAEAAGASNFTIIDRTTITQNTAVLGGGGIAIEGAHAFGSTINSTIIADNEDLSGQAPDVLEFGFGGGSVVPNTTFSLIGIADGSSFIPGNPSTSGNFVGSSNNPLSPLLTGLIDAGGSTMVHVPQAGSIVVDNGDPNVAGGLDQLGQSRVNGGRMDIGAVETLATLPDCDINEDGTCDCDDLNLLSGAVANGTNPLSHDLDGNGLVGFNDLLVWLADAGARPEHVAATGGNPFLLGDANLDGTVDGADFLIWNSNKFSNGAAYCQGDFNADGYVDGLDFVIWNANKFLSSDASALRAIPYPVATFQPLSRDAREEATDRVFRTNPLFRGW
ncbi:MAG: choice-of-anchor Q domain-containing protein, partial [Planctomycetota bacterium]